MKKTYYVYFVSYFGKDEKGYDIGSCTIKCSKPILDRTDFQDIEVIIKQDKCFEDYPVILSVTPLGKTRL